MSCSVRGCSNVRRFKPEGISFHTFPQEEELLNRWLGALDIKKENWVWSRSKFVCSDHFQPTDFIVAKSRRTLTSSAVPCIAIAGSSSIITESQISSESSLAASNSCVEEPEQQVSREPLKRKLSKTRKCTKQIHESSTTSSDSSAKRRKIEFIKKIHNYSISPRKLKARNEQLRSKQGKYRRKLYAANKKITVLKKEITTLKSVVNELKQEHLLSDSAAEHLEKSYESVPRMLLSRYLKNIRNGTITHETYPPALREFACVLQFYSNRAYEYVRNEFALALPHQATIRKWCSNINCFPGYIEQAFETIKAKAEKAANEDPKREIICSLLVDEMSIKKQIEVDGDQVWGYVNVGITSESEDLQPATEAFVVMIVAQQSHWKLPISYFLIKSLTGKEKANIIKENLKHLHEAGIKITSVTCDGPSVNFTMLKELGCDLEDVHNMKTWFTHPSDCTQKIHCILDVCHMLKLLRNLLASLQQFRDPEGNIVSWHYIKALYELQEQLSLHFANRLRRSHIEWYKQKMKVNLAAQTLSRSVADALEFLKNENVPEFQGCEATISFIRRADKLFDLLNSRSTCAEYPKAPLKQDHNEQDWRSFFSETIQYLLYCTDVGGRPLWSTPKKTPIIGFVVSILSFCGIFDEFVKTKRLNYLLTYKCSQDHLEIFFCSVRSRNGWNNNPSALQFMRTFRKLLLHSNISGRGGNCRVLDTTTVLTVPSSSQRKDEESFDISLYRKFNLEPSDSHNQDHDYDVVPCFFDLTSMSLNIITYISGFVVKMLNKTLKCVECLEGAGITSTRINEDEHYNLLLLKNRGGLYIPAKGVVTVVSHVEAQIRKVMFYTDNKLPNDRHFISYFVIVVAKGLYERVNELFPTLIGHFNEAVLTEHHGLILIKQIVRCYTRIRFFNLAKKYTDKIQGVHVRKSLNKLILFSHQ